MPQSKPLALIKLLHTAIWLFFVACIFGAPLAAWLEAFGVAFGLLGLVALEGVVLALNGGECPLTGWAARYTDSREPNFDIYLPRWLARWNKQIFTPLYLLGAAYVIWVALAR